MTIFLQKNDSIMTILILFFTRLHLESIKLFSGAVTPTQ